MAPTRELHKGRLLGVLLAGPLMAQADATVANVSIPSIRADLGASEPALELVVGGYLIAFAVLVITGARLGQTHGYRRLFMLGFAVFSLASLACALAPDPGTLVGARVLQGSGAALLFPQVLTGIQLNLAGAERARAIGWYAIALSSGAVLGQLLGGALINANIAGSHWRAIFVVNLPIGVAVLIAALRHLPVDHDRGRERVDVLGVATLTVTLLLVVLPLVLGRGADWPSWTWLCLAASAPAFALFLAVERRVAARAAAPLVDVPLLAGPAVRWALLALLVATGSYYALLFTLAQFLQRGLGESAFVSGLTLVPWVAAFGLAGQLVRRLPPDRAAVAPAAGCLLLMVAYAAISLALFGGHRSAWLLAVPLAAGGFGLGIQFSGLIAHLTDAVPARHAPDISGVSTTTLQIGGVLGVAGFGTLYLALASDPGVAHATHAFAITTAAFAAAALVAAAGAYRATHVRVATRR